LTASGKHRDRLAAWPRPVSRPATVLSFPCLSRYVYNPVHRSVKLYGRAFRPARNNYATSEVWSTWSPGPMVVDTDNLFM
jgi:hypothetical protein